MREAEEKACRAPPSRHEEVRRGPLLLVSVAVSLCALAGCGGGGSTVSDGPPAEIGPLKVSGGGSAQFRVEGGDNSIQDYGEEAGESELTQVARQVHGFYVARVRGEWKRACSYLSMASAQQLGTVATRSPQAQGEGCPAGLRLYTKPVPGSIARQITSVDAAALRHEGVQAFLVYTAPPGRTVYTMPLTNEGGSWKLGAISGAALPGT